VPEQQADRRRRRADEELEGSGGWSRGDAMVGPGLTVGLGSSLTLPSSLPFLLFLFPISFHFLPVAYG